MSRYEESSRASGPGGRGESRSRLPSSPARNWRGLGAQAAALSLGVLAAACGDGDGTSPASTSSGTAAVEIGADLHSLVVEAGSGRLFVGGHQAVGVSSDGGPTWATVRTLDAADAMGWGFGPSTVWVSGHPGLNRSDDGGRTFRRVNQGLPNTDVHAFGALGARLYAASPAVGLFASEDGGASWNVRTADAGQSFFGRILVDPAEPARLVAADARAGPVESVDGGKSWRRLGGVTAATWVSWAGGDPARLIASGPGGAAQSADGGRTWTRLVLPSGAQIVEASPADPALLYAAGLDGGKVSISVSRDGGQTWARP